MKGLAPHTTAIFDAVTKLECIKPFVLVGGTALSASLGDGDRYLFWAVFAALQSLDDAAHYQGVGVANLVVGVFQANFLNFLVAHGQVFHLIAH